MVRGLLTWKHEGKSFRKKKVDLRERAGLSLGWPFMMGSTVLIIIVIMIVMSCASRMPSCVKLQAL